MENHRTIRLAPQARDGPNALHGERTAPIAAAGTGRGPHSFFGSWPVGPPSPMTRDQLTDVTITSSEEFEAVLAGVVETAVEAGVDVRGAWEFETRGSTHEWELQIVELAKDVEAEDER